MPPGNEPAFWVTSRQRAVEAKQLPGRSPEVVNGGLQLAALSALGKVDPIVECTRHPSAPQAGCAAILWRTAQLDVVKAVRVVLLPWPQKTGSWCRSPPVGLSFQDLSCSNPPPVCFCRPLSWFLQP